MKLSVIGLGQCGCNIADEFYAVNDYAESLFNRRVEILTDAFAVNTDEADLGGFKHIPKDGSHRILLGAMNTFGHGVGKINTEAADIIKSSNMVMTDTILRSSKFHESDAVMVVASGGGGTGSGIIGWTVKSLKERIEKPVYAIVILPFIFEEKGQTSFAVMNAATSINTVLQYADAVFLVDNERYRRAGTDLTSTYGEINKEIAKSFYDLCCAGEERNQKYIGGKVMDAGDIKQSLSGLTSIGKGQVDLPTFRFRKNNFRETHRGQGATFGALGRAESSTSVAAKLEDARKVLFLVTAPKDAVSVNTMEEISGALQRKAPEAVVRMGDYPRRSREIVVTLIASQLTKIPRLESMFVQAEAMFKRSKEIEADIQNQVQRIRNLSANLPTLA